MTGPLKTKLYSGVVFFKAAGRLKEKVEEVNAVLKKSVDDVAEDVQEKISRMGKNAWIEWGDVELMHKKESDIKSDSSLESMYWRAQLKGRAFVIDRLLDKTEVPRHSNKKCVPKRKRGKKIIVRAK